MELGKSATPMPYIILADKNDEIDRRELTEAVTVGRSLECGIQVRDALLSRQHCRIEPIGSTWVLTDLNSRNGTFMNNGERMTQHVLEDGDIVRLGRVRMCFRSGPFVAPPAQTTYSKMMRPSDPVEALSGTVMGFVLNEVDMEEESRISGFPIPKPQPAEPVAYKREQVASMVAQMASRSWDTAAKSGETRKAARPLPQPMIKPQHQHKASAVAVAAPATKTAAPTKPANGTPKASIAVADVKPRGMIAPLQQKPASERKRPLHRACAWIAIGAAAAIYATAMYVIIQA
jgi:predicted component of type VI protein secretion system